MKFLVIVLSLLSSALAQDASLRCNYALYGSSYVCELAINNPNGLNNFTEIGGIHLEGFRNENVTRLYRASGYTSNVPSIICETFSNIVAVEFYYAGITEIDDNSFGGCTRMLEILLPANSIWSISENAFVNLPGLEYINLEYNSLYTLPDNVFASQQSMTALYLSNNAFEEFSVDLFRPLVNLERLYIGYSRLTTFNNQWFASNTRLNYLYLAGNRIVLSPDSFNGMEGITALSLADNEISEIPTEALAQLTNIQNLYLNDNALTELPTDAFPTLSRLIYLSVGGNPLESIQDGAFRALSSLVILELGSCPLRQFNSNSFEGLGNMVNLNLNFNEIEELQAGVFVPMPNLVYLGLWSNNLKTIRRSVFGTLTDLIILDLDDNIVNAIDRAVIDDAVNLDTFYFGRNLCANSYFGSFGSSRALFLTMLERCFTNMRYVIDTTTEAGAEFSFFEGLPPGIALRVNTENEVQIALTPFNFAWIPMVEILIGTSNNTRSVIRIDQETDVVTVPTPNVITRNQWNDFRITWANQNILVFRGNDPFPFMSYTMQSFFPVNFYGLSSIQSSALWSVQPFQ